MNEPHPWAPTLHDFQLGSASGALARDHVEGGEGGQVFVALAITLERQLWVPESFPQRPALLS